MTDDFDLGIGGNGVAAQKAPKAPCLSDARLEELRIKYGKIGVVEYNLHSLVFRRPSRDHVREYRRKQDTPMEKADAMDQLAQVTIVAFDLEDEPNKARVIFTEKFLEDYPLAVSNPRFVSVLTALAGLIEEEEYKNLGKGASVKSAPQNSSPKG
jgi:hypothetical protein